MAIVAYRTGLVLRGGRWSLRVCVPKELWPIFGKVLDRHRGGPSKKRTSPLTKQVWLPLQALSRAEAVKQTRLREAWIEGLYDEARALLGVSKVDLAPASLDAIKRAVQAYFYHLEQNALPVPIDTYDREVALERAIEDAGGMHGSPLEDGSLQRVAKLVAIDANLSMPPSSPLYYELSLMVKEALNEHASREVERLSLHAVGRRHPLFSDISPEKPPLYTMTVAEAITAFNMDPGKADVTPATVQARKFKFAAWQEFLGPSKAITSITRQDINAARDMLMKVPPHATQRYPGQSLREVVMIAERKQLKAMSPKSVRLYVETLASLFRWLHIEGYIAENRAVGISVPAESKEPLRRPFTHAELQKLFVSGQYAESVYLHRGWAFWVPLIALFHGLRSAEILGLESNDVGVEDGVFVFKLRSNATSRLKNDQSERIVPLHPELMMLGFKAYTASRPPNSALFPDLPGDKGRSIDAAGKSLMRWIRLSIPDEKVVFHSFRHVWTDALREADIPPEIQERLGGWKLAGRSARAGYGMGAKPARLAAEIAKVKYAGLDLSALRQSFNAQTKDSVYN